MTMPAPRAARFLTLNDMVHRSRRATTASVDAREGRSGHVGPGGDGVHAGSGKSQRRVESLSVLSTNLGVRTAASQGSVSHQATVSSMSDPVGVLRRQVLPVEPSMSSRGAEGDEGSSSTSPDGTPPSEPSGYASAPRDRVRACVEARRCACRPFDSRRRRYGPTPRA